MYIDDKRKFVTVKEFAQIMSLSEQQVRLWIKNGRIMALKLSESQKAPFRIPLTEVERLHAECYQGE